MVDIDAQDLAEQNIFDLRVVVGIVAAAAITDGNVSAWNIEQRCLCACCQVEPDDAA